MDISLNIILDRLSVFNTQAHLSLPSDVKLARAELLPPPPEPLRADRLYICRLSQIVARPARERRDSVFLCLRDRIQDAEETEELLRGVIIVNENLSFEKLFSFVQGIFCDLEDWYREAQKAVIQNKTLQDIVDLSEHIMQNYIQITDSSFNLLAYTRHIECDEEITVQARKYGYHPPSTVRLFNKYHRMEVWKKTTGILVNDACDMGKYPMLSKIFKFGSTYFAHSAMCCNVVPLTQGLIDLYGIFVDIISVFVEQDWERANSSHHIYDLFLTDIYEGNISYREIAEDRARNVGIPMDGNFCLSVSSQAEGHEQSLGRIAQAVTALRPGDKVTLFHGSIAVLSVLPQKDYLDEFELLREALTTVMEQYDLRCGMSAIFHDLMRADRAVTQARQALEYSGKTPGVAYLPELEAANNGLQKRTVSFEESFFYILLGGSLQNKEIWHSSVYYDALKMLHEYDVQHNMNNLQLLYVYLMCESKPTEAGNLLYMSRNNVVYRIERIERMLNMDLSSPSVRFKLQISYVLLQMYGFD